MTLDEFHRLAPEEATAALSACCGSRRWAVMLAARRPLDSLAELQAAAEEVWWELEPEDWLQAFAAHPRIGVHPPGDEQRNRWSAREQAGGARDDALRQALTRGNREYEERFGYRYIVNATGKTGEEMLAILHRRLTYDRETELKEAAGEQAAITRLRLGKLLD
ncbi:MAG: 2-oxo-4-hydroxy-4-carboxy-5-ureidoimidazoline decarboxylase [Thermoanaerobaculia bacterium]